MCSSLPHSQHASHVRSYFSSSSPPPVCLTFSMCSSLGVCNVLMRAFVFLRRSIHSACTRILRASFLRRSIHLACQRFLRVSSRPLCSRSSCSSPRSVSSRAVLCSRAPHSRASPASLRFFRTPCGSDLWFHFRFATVGILPKAAT